MSKELHMFKFLGGLSNSKVLNLESLIESQMHKKDSTFKMNLKV